MDLSKNIMYIHLIDIENLQFYLFFYVFYKLFFEIYICMCEYIYLDENHTNSCDENGDYLSRKNRTICKIDNQVL